MDILLVEDEVSWPRIVKDALEEEGLRSNGSPRRTDGIEHYFERASGTDHYADVMMPRWMAFEMVRRIRRMI